MIIAVFKMCHSGSFIIAVKRVRKAHVGTILELGASILKADL